MAASVTFGERAAAEHACSSGRWRGGLLAIVALGVVIRGAYTIWVAPWPPRTLTNEYYYSYLPSLISQEMGIIDPLKIFQGVHAPTAQHAPLYPLVLTILYQVGGTSQRPSGCWAACSEPGRSSPSRCSAGEWEAIASRSSPRVSRRSTRC